MPAQFESVVEVEALVGQTVVPAAEGELSFEILEATYGVNLPEQSDRAPFDKRLFRVLTRVSFSGNFSESFNSVNDGPKVVIGGEVIEREEGGAAEGSCATRRETWSLSSSNRLRPCTPTYRQASAMSCCARATCCCFSTAWTRWQIQKGELPWRALSSGCGGSARIACRW